jgi:hypothetical protein
VCMKALCLKRWGQLSMAALASIMVFSFSGCGSSVSSGPVEQYQQKVYVIGEIKDPAGSATEQISEIKGPADATKQVFVNRVAYDGVSADAPIFIAADRVLSLGDTMRKGLQDTYRNSYPIVVIYGGEAEINALLGILGLAQNYTLPDGFPYAEMFAIDKEGGITFAWSMYPQKQSNASPDTPDDPLVRTELFRDWISTNGTRMTQKVMAGKQEAAKAFAAAAEASTSEYEQIIHGYNHDYTFPSGRNIYKMTWSIYAVHSFEDMSDWFYVKQIGALNSKPGYRNAAIDDYGSQAVYMGSYTMDNWMGGFFSGRDTYISLLTPSPANDNSRKEVKSGIEHEFGPDVSFEKGAFPVSFGYKVKFSNETTVDVYDCDVFNNSYERLNNAAWLYHFNTVVGPIRYFLWQGLTDPSYLQRGLFQPVNNWLWKFAPMVRSHTDGQSFRAKFITERRITTHGDVGAWWVSRDPVTILQTDPYEIKVPLPYPPVMMVDNNLSVSKAGQSKAMDIGVDREWTASCDQPWCRVERANKRLNITVDENTTNANRNATITFRTLDGIGSAATLLFQSQY